MQEAGATADLVVSAVRIFGVVVLAVVVLYLLSGFLAFAGRNWARIVAGVLTAGFALLLVAALVVSGGAIDTITLAGVLLILILGAVAILFSPGASAWYAARRVSFARLRVWTPSRPSFSRAPAPSSRAG